jgi:hypothetical protein
MDPLLFPINTMAIEPLFKYAKELQAGTSKLKPGRIFSVWRSLTKDETLELTSFLAEVKKDPKAIMTADMTKYPLLSAQPTFFDGLGELIDHLLPMMDDFDFSIFK